MGKFILVVIVTFCNHSLRLGFAMLGYFPHSRQRCTASMGTRLANTAVDRL